MEAPTETNHFYSTFIQLSLAIKTLQQLQQANLPLTHPNALRKAQAELKSSPDLTTEVIIHILTALHELCLASPNTQLMIEVRCWALRLLKLREAAAAPKEEDETVRALEAARQVAVWKECGSKALAEKARREVESPREPEPVERGMQAGDSGANDAIAPPCGCSSCSPPQ